MDEPTKKKTIKLVNKLRKVKKHSNENVNSITSKLINKMNQNKHIHA